MLLDCCILSKNLHCTVSYQLALVMVMSYNSGRYMYMYTGTLYIQSCTIGVYDDKRIKYVTSDKYTRILLCGKHNTTILKGKWLT